MREEGGGEKGSLASFYRTTPRKKRKMFEELWEDHA